MQKHKVLPITFLNYEFEDDCYIFYDVEFLEDFGNFKEGYCDHISVEFDEGVIYHTNENGDTDALQKFKIIKND